MAKLDEIAELLTEELHNFEQSVKHLEQVRESLDNYSLIPDTSKVDFLLQGYNDQQQKILKEQTELIQSLIYKVRNATLFPGWLIKLFWGWCFLNLVMWGYSVNTISRWPEKQKIAIKKGAKQYTSHFKEFFDQHPEAREAYQNWIKHS